MSRRSRIAVTDVELRKLREPCPARPCKGYAAQMVLSRTSWMECTDCGHQWLFRDASSKVITREQRDELVKPRTGGRGAGESEERRVVARRREQYKQEAQEMTKSKKAAKKPAAKRVGKTAKDGSAPKGPSLVKALYDFMVKNPGSSSEDVAAAGKKAFPMKEMNLRSIAWYRSMWSRGERLPKGATKALPKAKAEKAIKTENAKKA